MKTQKIKVERSDLSSFFDEIIFTNSANTEKPEKKAYDLCQKVKGLKTKEVLWLETTFTETFLVHSDNNFKFAFFS